MTRLCCLKLEGPLIMSRRVDLIYFWSHVRRPNTHNNQLTAFIRDNPGEQQPELSETLTRYTTFVVLIFFTSTPILASWASRYTSRV